MARFVLTDDEVARTIRFNGSTTCRSAEIGEFYLEDKVGGNANFVTY